MLLPLLHLLPGTMLLDVAPPTYPPEHSDDPLRLLALRALVADAAAPRLVL